LAAAVLHVVLAFGGLVASAVASAPTAVRLLALAASTVGFIGVGTIGHTASHGALTPSRTVDRVVLHVFYPLILGLSAVYWRDSHVVRHHRAPNVSGVDADTDLRPLLALNEDHLRDNGGLRARFPALQALLLLAILPWNGFLIQVQAAAHLARCAADPARRTKALAADLACLAAHYGAWIVVPALFFPLGQVIGLYALRVILIGSASFAILAPGHYPREALSIAPKLYDELPFVLRQTLTTANFRTGPLGRLICSGLENQIEHHLFPGVSHVHLRRMAPAVRGYLQERGLPYHEFGWGAAIAKSFQVFLCPKPVIAHRETLERLVVSPPPNAPIDVKRPGFSGASIT
jgi:fatty acid desaturase